VNAVATARSSTGGQTLKETENRVSVAREATRERGRCREDLRAPGQRVDGRVRGGIARTAQAARAAAPKTEG